MKNKWEILDTNIFSDAYEVQKSEVIDEVNSQAIFFVHKKTKARVLVLHNDDNNKTFSVSFRTPPADGTGVAHIIEHTVLCGSKQFPAKDPFVELAKGSMNTFLNAMTFPDKTMYPVASCNQKDFQNLMHVYLDAVFFPNIYDKEEIFKQEGWHYELESIEDEITYNGVVYNEMKGVFSSPEERMESIITKALYPDTPYAFESGGDPDEIPELTREAYLDFHRKYYHPSNSYIFLYGDMDVNEKLVFIDENYLSKFDKLDIDSTIPAQKSFDSIKEVTEEYAVSEDSEEEKTYLEYAVSVGTSLDIKTNMAMRVLRRVLFGNAGAPLRRALMDAEIGENVVAGFSDDIYQPMFEIEMKGAKEEHKQKFLQVIRETIERLIKDGLDKQSLQASINSIEFKVREGKANFYPAGVLYAMDVMTTWLYDDEKVFDGLYYEETLQFLKDNIDTGYYEELLKKYFLENTHAALIVLKSSKGLTKRKEEQLALKLQEKKSSMSTQQLEKMVEDTKALKEYQETPSTPEELEKIPLLALEDIDPKAVTFQNKENTISDVPVIWHEYFTKGISYVKYFFEVNKWKAYAPYLSMLDSLLGTLSTEKYSYLELSNEEDLHTGGIGFATTTMSKVDGDEPVTDLYFVVTGKAIYGKETDLFRIMQEEMFTSKLTDKKRIKEYIDSAVISKRNEIQESGNRIAAFRAMSYENESFYLRDMTDGVGYYEFLCKWKDDFEEKADELISVLEFLVKEIFDVKKVIVSYIGDGKGWEQGQKPIEEVLRSIEEKNNGCEKTEVECETYPVEFSDKREAFVTPGQVQFDAMCGSYKALGYSYCGTMNVLSCILNYDYLWNQVRVKGGAYGVSVQFEKNGNYMFSSYRDPNLRRTYEVYKNASEYVKAFDADEREMTKYIIGAVNGMEMPYAPSTLGAVSFANYLTGYTNEKNQKVKDEILTTTVEKIKCYADMLDKMAENAKICVVGSESEVTKEKELFQNIITVK